MGLIVTDDSGMVWATGICGALKRKTVELLPVRRKQSKP
jgi:hypothetical protein